jgi:hypothetical protein
MTTVKETIQHAYKVVLSTKHEIPFDPEELPKVMSSIAEGVSVLLKKGLFNPSYYVCIVEDEKRRYEFLEDTKYDKHDRDQGMRPLSDIFANRKLLPGIENDILQIQSPRAP